MILSEATRYHNARLSLYDVCRCPVHLQAVAMLDGKLSGKCDACCAEAALGLRRLKKMRSRA